MLRNPIKQHESIGAAWKERGRAAGEKSKRSDFHPETVRWCPTALWSPGGNNIQLTFQWRNLIRPPLASNTLLRGWHPQTLAHTHLNVNHPHTHVHNWKNTSMADSRPNPALWPLIFSSSYMRRMFLGSFYYGFEWHISVPCYKRWETVRLHKSRAWRSCTSKR